MKTLSSRSVALFVASLAIGTTLPLALNQSMNAYAIGDSITTSDGVSVRLHPSFTTKDRVDYGRAIDIYNLFLQEGKTGLLKPDINNRASIDFYLNNPGTGRPQMDELRLRTEPLSTNEYVKPEEDVSPVDALSQQERAALLRSEKTGVCWKYAGFSPGYMALCKKFIKGKATKRTSGFQTDLIYTRSNGRVLLRDTGSSSSRITAPLTVKDYNYNSTSSKGTTRRGLGSSSSSSK